MRDYSHELADVLQNHLDHVEWKYHWNEEEGCAHYVVSLSGPFHSANGCVKINRDSMTTYLICPLRAETGDRGQMANMAEFLSRANYGLTHGNFEFDFRDGEIRFKLTQNCNGIVPSENMMNDMICIPTRMMNRYGKGVLQVLFGTLTPEEAVNQCENSIDDEVLDLMRSLHLDPEGLRTLLSGQMEQEDILEELFRDMDDEDENGGGSGDESS